MAALYNLDHTLSVAFYLFSNVNDKEWIKYEIVVESESCFSSPIIFNDETANTELYLENFIEPEIPELVRKFNDLCKETINGMIFQPIDDRDFTLEVYSTHDSVKVDLQLEFPKRTQAYTFYTTKANLAKFSRQLEKEYVELINGKQALLVYE